jgi:tetratricopeptide (TPR) repeat protein
MLTRMVVRPALAGRARELAELHARLAAARAGDGGLLLVTGPPGIGKSALVQAAAADAADEGLLVLTGRSTDDAAPPLWPWAPVLAGLGLPSGVSAPVAGTGEDAQVARFTALQSLAGDLLGALPRGGTLVVLDDLHWADATSTALLRALAPRLPGSPLLVLATHRPVRAGSPGRRSALAAELPWVQAEPAVASVRLGPLDLAAVEELLGSLLGAHAAAALAEPVLVTTRGNALFVRTVGRLLADVPAAERPGLLASLSTSPELSDVVRSWTRGLPAACLDLLRVAGLAGREVDVGAVAAVRGLPHDEVLELLDAALAAGVLERLPSGALAFVHDVVRDALAVELPAAEQAACSRALAGHLERVDAAPADVARHWLRGARSEQERRSAVIWARRAAAVAVAGLDWTSAQDLLSQALRAAAGAPGSERAELHLELAEVRYCAGDVGAALRACRSAADLAAGLPDGPVQAGLLAAAAVVVQGMGAPDVNTVLIDLTERALLAGPAEPELARVLAQRACALMQLDRTQEAAPLSQQALDLALRAGLPQAELDAVRARHLVVGEPARHLERTALAERALELATELHQPVARLWALLWLVDSAFVAVTWVWSTRGCSTSRCSSRRSACRSRSGTSTACTRPARPSSGTSRRPGSRPVAL